MTTTDMSGAIDPEIYIDRDGRYEDYSFWMGTCGLHEFYAQARDLLGDVDGKHLMDCGCGIGNTAIMFTRRGATVQGFDVDDGVLAKARMIAAANGVDVDYSKQGFETIDYADASFDLAFGSCVLHHVDIEKAAQQLGRVIKPGGRAVFIENSNRNPLLMFARSNIVGRFGVPKYGDDEEEHPLRDDEIALLRQHFPGTVTVHYPALVLFRLLDFYIFRGRVGAVTRLMRGLDKAFGAIPYFRSLGYFQVLEFRRDQS